MNLLETVLDYMLQTEVVVKALVHFREKRWSEERSLDDLELVLGRFPEDQVGNTALALLSKGLLPAKRLMLWGVGWVPGARRIARRPPPK